MFTTMMTITIAVVALLGGWLSLQGIVSVGVIATFVVYVMNFFRPMRGIAMLYNGLQSALAGAERIFEVLDDEPSVANQPNARPLPKIKGEVTFDNVSFAYEEGKPVLEDVTLTAAPGQTIALVGPTGAGKTTIISLLSRFYDVTEGAIRIDGQDIREVEQSSIRDQLGIVLQDTFLFAESVMENIRYGRLTPPTKRSSRRPGWPTPTTSSARCPRAMAPWSRKRGTTSARDSANCWPSRGPCWPIRAS
jgi:ABC-type multidrug transport system fused ATPase/permease subunit